MSEGRSRSAGAQEPECILKYLGIPSTAGTRDPERNRFFTSSVPLPPMPAKLFSKAIRQSL
ncbi:MAG: hypothetical protein ACREYE_29560 [Gammaproteobacteria bacterium]